jgi:hypothetical protein
MCFWSRNRGVPVLLGLGFYEMGLGGGAELGGLDSVMGHDEGWGLEVGGGGLQGRAGDGSDYISAP